MKENKFCHIIEGIGTTTEVDKHGDKLTLDSLKTIKQSIEEGNIDFLYNHEEDNKIGEIIECEIFHQGGVDKLRIKVGIYKGKEEYVEMMKNRILTGFSIGFLDGGTKKEFDNCGIKLEVSPWIRHEVDNALEKNNIRHIDYVRKGAEATAIIGLAIQGLGLLVSIVTLAYTIWMDKKTKNPEIQPPKISLNVNGNNNVIVIDSEEKLEEIKRLARNSSQ
jgi:hypothetical protein